MKTNYLLLLFLMMPFCGNIKGQVHINNRKSAFIIDSIYSQSLGQTRTYCIYLPPDIKKSETYDVIFAADGQIYEETYFLPVDSLISSKIIMPVIFIGAFSNEKETPNGKNFTYRQLEYIEDYDKEIFDDHYAFFTRELVDSIKAKYQIKIENDKKTFYGFSNGAALGLSVFFTDRELFKNYIFHSPAGFYTSHIKPNDNQCSTNMYIAYGEKEIETFKEHYEKLVKTLSDNGYQYDLLVYDGGHDRKTWWDIFINTLPELFQLTTG